MKNTINIYNIYLFNKKYNKIIIDKKYNKINNYKYLFYINILINKIIIHW